MASWSALRISLMAVVLADASEDPEIASGGGLRRNETAARERILSSLAGAISDKVEDMDGYPMCGYSKLHLEEDPVRRFCLRQCRVESNGMIRPTFDEWEQYCRETAAMPAWDSECEAYLSCTFGCEVWGGNRDAMLSLSPSERYEFLMDTKADMYAEGITKEQRCVLDKCHAYCAKLELHSCREAQYRQGCLAGDPTSYQCDVDCNGAWKPPALRRLALLAALLASYLAVGEAAA
mmetsp:Transcript_97319/g.272357  ORF Transcript_97319/g.272357 Transcript_97319/m.272357 type:complete len:236 (-) Transcript_97319:67-774(-)